MFLSVIVHGVSVVWIKRTMSALLSRRKIPEL